MAATTARWCRECAALVLCLLDGAHWMCCRCQSAEVELPPWAVPRMGDGLTNDPAADGASRQFRYLRRVG